jgi:ATP-binding cassette subfamily B protein
MARWIQIYSRFNEALTSIKTVKAFVMEDIEQERFLRNVKKTNGLVLNGVRTDSFLGTAKNLSTIVARIAVMGYGSYLAIQGEITLGTLVAFLSYLNGLYSPIVGVAGLHEGFCRAKVYLDAIFEIIDAPTSKDSPSALEMDQLAGEVRFESVCFDYRTDRPVLRNVSFLAPPGHLVALVGPSGAGKTTITDLISRFYDPVSGSILIDGVDSKLIKQSSLRKHIGMVLQDTMLFNETIRNNIGYGKPEATLDEIVRAAQAANADAFIRSFPDGYDTVVGERGCLLSAGERQRIAIARAVLKNPSIFIFDEASSHLDAESEALIQQAIRQFIRGKTTFVIAHRLSTIVKADLILVMKDGQIFETGTHYELLQQRGLYYRLVSRQSFEADLEQPMLLHG